jgi:hypothetical protein
MATGGNSYGFDFLRAEHKVDDDVVSSSHHAAAALQNRETSILSLDGTSLVLDASHKPELEKQQDILYFLKKHRESSLAPSIIYRATGVNLDVDVNVAEALQRNPKIKTEFIPDPENPSIKIAHYAFQAKYPRVRDRATLLAQINALTTGVKTSDLVDCYSNCREDIGALITAGDIIAVANTEDKDKILFPRGDAFLVELDGYVSLLDATRCKNVTDPQAVVAVDADPTRQIRRGEAVRVGGQWCRISSAIKHGVPLSDQPTRAMAPLSVTSFVDLPKRNEQDGYVRPFSAKLLPLDHELTESARANLRQARTAREHIPKASQNSNANASNPVHHHHTTGGGAGAAHGHHHHKRSGGGGNGNNNNSMLPPTSKRAKSSTGGEASTASAASDPAFGLYAHAWRHGCTTDVRDMFLATRKLVPESDKDLQEALVKHGLLGPHEQMRLPRLSTRNNVDNDGKPKKRRYYERKNQRITNTHLNDTDIGASLARALELQNQGKTVGDGGM